MDAGHLPQQTAHDLFDRLLSWLGGNAEGVAHVDMKRAILDAYREIPTLANWTYYIQIGRLFLKQAYSTGTVEYDFTGGAEEKMLTLTGGVWPDWIERAFIRIGVLIYDVDRRISDTVITLGAPRYPDADIATTTYTAIQDSYQLPIDFTAGDRGLPENNWGDMQYCRPQQWLGLQRNLQTSGIPRYYTFTRDPKSAGRLVVRIFPPPETTQTLDYTYRCRCREIETWDYTNGVATCAGATNVVTFTGPAIMQDKYVGSTIRFSVDGRTVPTGPEGLNPYFLERQIVAVTNSTTIVVDDEVPDPFTAVRHRISDPIDIEPGAMFNAMMARALCFLATNRNRTKELPDLSANWRFLLDIAKEADMRDGASDRATLGGRYRQRLANMPAGTYVE